MTALRRLEPGSASETSSMGEAPVNQARQIDIRHGLGI